MSFLFRPFQMAKHLQEPTFVTQKQNQETRTALYSKLFMPKRKSFLTINFYMSRFLYIQSYTVALFDSKKNWYIFHIIKQSG